MAVTRSLPRLFYPACALSMALSAGVLGLSVVNFGLLSRWYNAAASILAILFHSTLFLLIWRQPRSTGPTEIVIPPGFSSPVSEKISMDEDASYPKRPHSIPDFHIIHHMAALLSLTLLNIIYFVAFGIMMDITLRGGAKSTLPGERAPGMTRPWNIKVQIAQTTLIGTQALALLVLLGTCAIDRSNIAAMHDEQREEIEFGLESSEKPQIDL